MVGLTLAEGPNEISIEIPPLMTKQSEPHDFNPQTNSSLLYQFILNPSDPARGEEFVRQYEPLVKKYLLKFTADNDELNDLKQDIFLKILKYVKTFKHRGVGSFRAWLKTVVHSVHQDWLRDWKAKGKFLNLPIPDEVACLETLSQDFTREYDREIMMVAISRVRLEIDPRTWEMFELFKMEGVSAEKVAERFGVTVAAVYSGSKRMTAKLRSMCTYLDSRTPP